MKKLFILLIILLAAAPTLAQAPTPTMPPIEDLIQATPDAPILPSGVVIGEDQIFYQGRPLLAAEQGGLLISYTKWLFGSGSAAAFGPFAPILIHVAIIMTISFFMLSVWIVQQIFGVTAKVFLTLIRFVRGGG